MRKKKEMPKPDVALKDFFKDNEIFAAVFNGYFFEGRNVMTWVSKVFSQRTLTTE